MFFPITVLTLFRHPRRQCRVHTLLIARTILLPYAVVLTLSRRVLPAADVASPSLAGHIFETILHPYTQHTLLDSLENLLLDGI